MAVAPSMDQKDDRQQIGASHGTPGVLASI
jgi:hypothetical protein